MKIQHPLLVRAIGATGAAVVRQLGRTIRYHFRYQDPDGRARDGPPDRPKVHLCVLP